MEAKKNSLIHVDVKDYESPILKKNPPAQNSMMAAIIAKRNQMKKNLGIAKNKSGQRAGIPPPLPPQPPPPIINSKNMNSFSEPINSSAELEANKNNLIHEEVKDYESPISKQNAPVQNSMMAAIIAKRNQMKKSLGEKQASNQNASKQNQINSIVPKVGEFNAMNSTLQQKNPQMSGEETNSNLSNKINVLKPNVELREDNSKQESSINDKNIINEEDDIDDKELCSICMENKSESVFIPCGHRCVCFNCGDKIINSQNKKCPICQEEASFLLKKVFDS